MTSSLKWRRRALQVKDSRGAVTTYISVPKQWAEANIAPHRYVEIQLLSDGSLRISPEGDHE